MDAVSRMPDSLRARTVECVPVGQICYVNPNDIILHGGIGLVRKSAICWRFQPEGHIVLRRLENGFAMDMHTHHEWLPSGGALYMDAWIPIVEYGL